MLKELSQIPLELIQFILVAGFSLIIGLSQRKLHGVSDNNRIFGTDRTFTFIGILGFILYKIDNEYLTAFLGGGFILCIFLAIFYYNKIKNMQDYGLTTVLIALITYCLSPLIFTQPLWLFLLIVVTVLILTEIKGSLTTLSEKFEREEFISLGKFIFIAGVILPIVPNEPFIEAVSLTPYKVWLAVVVISGISYFSYLLQKFVFRDSGVIVSGILGGLYSSTATTVILAKKAREHPGQKGLYVSAIILAISMMYLRILILLLVFNAGLFRLMGPGLGILFIISTLTGLFIYKSGKHNHARAPGFTSEKNPLEFKVALLFALLYVIFFLATHYTFSWFGKEGLVVLSVLTGVSDIDPYLISLFQGKLPVSLVQIAIAANIAIISNNVIKAVYTIIFGDRTLFFKASFFIGILALLNLVVIFFL